MNLSFLMTNEEATFNVFKHTFCKHYCVLFLTYNVPAEHAKIVNIVIHFFICSFLGGTAGRAGHRLRSPSHGHGGRCRSGLERGAVLRKEKL